MAKISISLGSVRVVVQVARYVGRSLTQRYHKRKVKIPKIKYGVPGIFSKAFSLYYIRMSISGNLNGD